MNLDSLFEKSAQIYSTEFSLRSLADRIEQRGGIPRRTAEEVGKEASDIRAEADALRAGRMALSAVARALEADAKLDETDTVPDGDTYNDLMRALREAMR